MEFFDEFLKSNRKEDLSLTQFLLNWDIQHQTVLSLTLNHDTTLVNILKKVLRDFLKQVDISQIPEVSKKIDTLLKQYILFLEESNINISVQKIGLYLQKNCQIKYWQYMLYFSDKLWNKAEVYDDDHNFVTRRLALARMANEVLGNVLYKNTFDEPLTVI